MKYKEAISNIFDQQNHQVKKHIVKHKQTSVLIIMIKLYFWVDLKVSIYFQRC